MASRIAASIANGVGMREVMVARTMEEYEEIVVRLALNPFLLAKAKRKLVTTFLNLQP